MAEFTDAIIKIIDKKIKTIDTAELDLYGQLNDVEKIIFEDLKKAINKLNVDGGTIQFDEKNIDLVNQLDRVMIEAIQGSNMPSAITKYLRNFQTISDFNFDIHKNVNDLSKTELEKLVSPIQKLSVERTLNGLTGSGVNTNFIEPVRQGIFQNIVAGTNRTQLEQYLSNYVLGNPNVDGLYSRYVKQVSRDALNQFDGQTNARIADEFGLDAFRYVGSLIDDSRPQCRRWIGKRVLQKSELQSEINWANNNGTGMISGTTPDNFSIYRGGYNCRHAAIPFKLTKSQREKLDKQQPVDSKTETEINTDIKKIKSKIKQGKKPTPIDDFSKNNIFSSIDVKDKKTFVDLLQNQDDSIGISIENKTSISIMNDVENFSVTKKTNPFNSLNVKIVPMGDNSGGLCNIYNDYVSIRYNPKQGEQILNRGYDNELELFQQREIFKNEQLSKIVKDYKPRIGERRQSTIEIDGTKYSVDFVSSLNSENQIVYRTFSISDISQSIDKNVATTITHEFSHLIHNKLDPKFGLQGVSQIRVPKPQRDIITDFAKKKGMKLIDSPTIYGETNWSEFYAECSTAYIHAPKWFEKYHKKAFDFFVELNESEYKFDLKTLTQYK